MKTVLNLPRISMNMEEGTIVSWRKKEGDRYKKGEVLYDIETEKVTSEVEAPTDGKLVRIIVRMDESVEVGAPVCEVEEE